MEPLPTSFCEKLSTYKARGACFELVNKGDTYEVRQFFVYYDDTLLGVEEVTESMHFIDGAEEKWESAKTQGEKKAAYLEMYKGVSAYVDEYIESAESINEFNHFMRLKKEFCREIGMDPIFVGEELNRVKNEMKGNLRYYRYTLYNMGKECELSAEENEELDELVGRMKVLESRG